MLSVAPLNAAPPPKEVSTDISVVRGVNYPRRVLVTVEAKPGTTVVLQRSSDLKTWIDVATHKFKKAPFVYTYETADGYGFFRTVTL